MIEASKFLTALKDRVKLWQFWEIYATVNEAKQQAAKLFIKSQGVCVKETKEGSYIVLYWRTCNDN